MAEGREDEEGDGGEEERRTRRRRRRRKRRKGRIKGLKRPEESTDTDVRARW